MDSQIDLRGASGALYRYRHAGTSAPKTAMSGTFAYVKGSGPEREVLYLGQTDNLMEGARCRWDEAAQQYGATQLFVRLNIAAAARSEELDDLLQAMTPPMNGGQ